VDRKPCSTNPTAVLVLSQHAGVRRQLVEYLARSPGLDVVSSGCDIEVVRAGGGRVIVLDHSRVESTTLAAKLAVAVERNARILALASIHDPEQERAVRAAGGVYRLKAVGDGDLVGIILARADGLEPTPLGST
jgi:hypothetical protein